MALWRCLQNGRTATALSHEASWGQSLSLSHIAHRVVVRTKEGWNDVHHNLSNLEEGQCEKINMKASTMQYYKGQVTSSLIRHFYVSPRQSGVKIANISSYASFPYFLNSSQGEKMLNNKILLLSLLLIFPSFAHTKLFPFFSSVLLWKFLEIAKHKLMLTVVQVPTLCAFPPYSIGINDQIHCEMEILKG